ncbi:MAG: hypothetical protein Q8L75_02500, partial [Acidobacteriota bacterium]|nr:hypothetical protein [Acidobacteriota bacterium]
MLQLWAATAAVAVTLLASVSAQVKPALEEWRQWRGPFNTGMAHGDAPLTWNDQTNIKWKLAIPGRGHSTPVVTGNRL